MKIVERHYDPHALTRTICSAMSRTIHCPQCGAEQSSDAVEGLCPDCLARLALGGGDMPEDLGMPGPKYQVPGAELRFGDYELIEEIAQGGMGVVYKARQTSLNRTVAVKMIRFGNLAREEDVRRFRTEAEAAANLQHPNIVAIHEVGFAEGQHFFSMDYIEGGSLAELIRERPLPPRKAATYLKTIAETIHYAHSRGVLHRDLKPSNVLLDEKQQPKISDFGLAKLMQSDSKLTLSGTVMGSPSYMSPEQASGRGHSLSVQGDVYSLGAILYELLTGRPPFQADTTLEVLRLVIDAEPVSLRQLNKNIPHDLDTICLKCLEKAPDRRYSSAQELAEELGRFLRDEPILARPVGPATRAWRWCRRKPALAAALLTIITLFFAGFGGVLSQWQIAQQRAESEREARLLAEHATVQAHLGKARTMRLAGLAGQRFEGLEAIRSAAALGSSLDLRNEAITYLSLPDLRRVKGWTNEIVSAGTIAFDRGLTRYAQVDAAGKIRIRGMQDQQVIADFAGGNTPASLLMFSPENRYLASLHEEENGRELRVWDLSLNAELPAKISRLGAEAVDFAPDNGQIAVGFLDGSVEIRSLPSLEPVQTFAFGRPVFKLRYRPDGSGLAACSPVSHEVRLFELGSSERPSVLYHRDGVIDLAWHPTGKFLATVSTLGMLSFYEGEGTPVRVGSHNAYVSRAAFNHAGTVLATLGTDQSVRLWDFARGKVLVRLQGVDATQLQFSRDDRLLACGSGTAVELLEVTIPGERRSLIDPRRPGVNQVQSDVSPDGNLFCIAANDGIHFWDVAEGKLIGSIQLGAVRSLLFDRAKGDLIARSAAGLFRLPLLATAVGHHRVLLAGPPRSISGHSPEGPMSMSADGATLVMVSEDQVLLQNSGNTGGWIELSAEPGVKALAVSPNGKWIAAGNWLTGSVHIWERETEKLALTLPMDGPMALAFSPDNQWLAVNSEKACRFWETASWRSEARLIRTYSGAGTSPVPAAFSPDATLMALPASPRTVELIEISSGASLATLELPEEGGAGVVWMQFAPDGAELYCLQPTPPLMVWDLRAVRAALKDLGLDWAGSVPSESKAVKQSIANGLPPRRLIFNQGNLNVFSRAWADLQTARMQLEEAPEEARSWRKVAEMEFVLRRHAQVVETAGAFLERLGDEASTESRRQEWMAQRADAFVALGRYDEAAELYRGCAEINPGSGWGLKALKDLSSTYLYGPPHFRNLDLVRHYAGEALRFNPEDQTALSRIGMADFRSGRYEESLSLLERSCALRAGSTACYALVILYARQGRIEEARQLFDSNTAALFSKSGFLTEREVFLNWAGEAEEALRSEQAKSQPHLPPSL
jgi:eukaryotic-like serine/threonine-protein kinase